jgi:ubiquinone/menaquinone biosynthesis C-methylase UbiE
VHASQQDERYLATGFRNVDGGAARKMARCLEFLDLLPSFQGYKNLILEEIKPQPGGIAADLGCGLGFDVRRLARLVGPRGRALGVDSSMTLLESAVATSRGFAAVSFIRADIHNLPFENGSLDCVKADRVLQHVQEPSSVVAEMFRTVRRGGKVVCAEPDWRTFTVEHGNHAMVRQVTQLFGQSFRNPWIGTQLSGELEDAGFVDIKVQPWPLVAPSFEDSDRVFDLVQTAERLTESTGSDEPLAWIADARKCDTERPVRSSVTLYLNFGRKP